MIKLKHYTAIFKADGSSGGIQSSYVFHTATTFGWLPDTTLESLAATLRERLCISGTLCFFQLDSPIVVDEVSDIKASCRPFSNSESLAGASSIRELAEKLGPEGTVGEGPEGGKYSVALVTVWIPPAEFTSVSRRSMSPIREESNSRESIALMVQDRPSPSTGAKTISLVSTQKQELLDAAYNHRPPELTPPPLAIYHPVFSQFRQEMLIPTESLDFTASELFQASEFIDVSLRHYHDEAARRAKLCEVLAFNDQTLWSGIEILVNATTVKLDGGNQMFINIGLPPVYPLMAELKNGLGDGGCDPSDQVHQYFMKVVSSEQYNSIRQLSCCPALLIGLAGPILVVWGGVFADRFFFERLALVYIGPQPPTASPSPTLGRSDAEVGIREVAKLLRTLGRCLEVIRAHYFSLRTSLFAPAPISPSSARAARGPGQGRRPQRSVSSRPNSPDPSRFVHWTSFTSEGRQYNLTYIRRLTIYMEKTVFQATMTPSTPNPKFQPKTVVVKFAHRYGEAGHRLLAAEKLAPSIYYCAFEETIGLWVVVMEYVSGRPCSGKLIKGEATALSRAIAILHEKNLVFGDLREPNVIIADPENRVCLVDFEWSGPCEDVKGNGGQVLQRRVRYPTNISLEIGIDWAEGVERDEFITKRHDIYRLTKMTS